MIRYAWISFVFCICFAAQSFAFEAIGGNITWSCTGTGRFIFQLTLYRDCTGSDVTGNIERIRVWNHPTLTTIDVNLSTRTDISPSCNAAGGASPFTCGVGPNGGSGPGALEKLVYLSDPIDVTGTPPLEGWVFTFETTARKASINNLTGPDGAGMTLVSKMFEITPNASACLDNAPRMLNDPLILICAGKAYEFVPDFSDLDLDSLEIKLGTLWKDFPVGVYQEGVVPAAVSYAGGFSATNPTPNAAFSGANIAAAVDPDNGDLTFTSATNGEYTLKLVVTSYRNGRRNAEVEFEFTPHIIDCNFPNNAPAVSGPFAGLFEITVAPNTPVNFTISSSDPELKQDGSAQENILTASGAMFGTNFTSNAGCAIVPCATLNNTPPITGVQSSSVDFSWQPSCNHLKNTFGNEFTEATYDFVFQFQDDVCPMPLSTMKRVRITVKADITVTPAKIDCIQVRANGDLTINWTAAIDPNANFTRYELHSVQSGLISTFNSIASTSFTFTPFVANSDYFIKTFSGNPCVIAQNSDTVHPINLNVTPSASGGIAQLSWNSPFFDNSGHSGNYQVFREFPSGTWTEIGQTVFNFGQFFDTIDICSADLNYLIQFTEGTGCTFISSIDGGAFIDETPPTDKPIIQSVSIDTISGSPVITWNAITVPDTYGYIIYFGNSSTEVDTAVGINTTSYTYTLSPEIDSVSFSISAIDSCLTPGKTSPESIRHKTSYLQSAYDLCNKEIDLRWTAYQGWDLIKGYNIFVQIDGGLWQMLGFTKSLNYSTTVDELKNYHFVIEALDSNSTASSFSNPVDIFTESPTKPSFHYTELATVENGDVDVLHYIDRVSGVGGLQLERLNEKTGQFELLGFFDFNSNHVSYTDTDADTDDRPYTYQVRIIDSCGTATTVANQVTTIHLKVKEDNLNLTNFLSWTPYKGFNGSILYYNIYRGIEGVFGTLPEAQVPPNQLHFLDTLFPDIHFNGKICYYVEAVEAVNVYGFNRVSHSNIVCTVMEPLIYVPNTFTPNGDLFNGSFAPSINLTEIMDYEFNIINRWGELIYKSFDRNEAWNGTLDGKDCQEGTYQYVLRVKNGEGQEIVKRGFVNLLR